VLNLLRSPRFWQGFGRILLICPPQRKYKPLVRPRAPEEVWEEDWKKLGTDMERAWGSNVDVKKIHGPEEPAACH